MMKELVEKIKKEGKVLPGDIVKVDSFINHQIDVDFMEKIGEEFYKLFKNEKVTKVLTIETSGILAACETAKRFKCKVVYGKKGNHKNQSNDFYETKVYSYTKGEEYLVKVSKDYISKDDNILIIDDFLANGAAVGGMIDIINKAGAKLLGVGIIIEKGFQKGGDELRKRGIKLESLAIIDSIDIDKKIIKFRGE